MQANKDPTKMSESPPAQPEAPPSPRARMNRGGAQIEHPRARGLAISQRPP